MTRSLKRRIFSFSLSTILVSLAIISTVVGEGSLGKAYDRLLNPSLKQVITQEVMVDRPRYQIEATYNDQKDLVTGTVVVTLPEMRTEPQKEVYFRLYPNVFQNWKYNKESKPQKPGYLSVKQVKVDGKPIKEEMKDTVMKVPLPSPVPIGKSARIEMNYELQLPQGGTRLNKYKNTAFLAQWYPMLAIKDQDGWHTEPYTTVGDPFFTQMSDFEVTFHVPKGYQIISTAKDQIQTTSTDVTLEQSNVRDFVAVITKDYQMLTGKAGKVDVNLWYLKGMEDVSNKLHQAAIDGMKFYSERFGEYPYEEIDVVLGDTGYGIAGMEYPGLVTSIPKTPTLKGEVPAVNVVVHELAHQWWYGVVGNNQVKEPWLDEGLTTFSEFLFMKKKMKEDEKEWLKRAVTRTDQIHETMGATCTQKLYEYPDSIYGLMVYIRPAAMMFDLMDQLGEEKVMQIMRTYYQKFKYRTATTKDFLQVASEVAGKDLQPFFDQWLNFKGSTKKR